MGIGFLVMRLEPQKVKARETLLRPIAHEVRLRPIAVCASA